MSNGQVQLTIKDGVAHILIDRPEARNAMTWAMYEALANICDSLAGNPDIKAATFRGAGGEAFVAGTDIEQFRNFQGGEDGIAYEKIIDERIAQPSTIATVGIGRRSIWAMRSSMIFS